jgi:DNA-binding NarL/FixJ family response regulator
MAVRILIVDDHEIVREGVRSLIGRSRPEWEVCGEAMNGREAVGAVKTLRPDVVVLDLTMPVMDGLEATPQITALGLGARVLIFTMHESAKLSAEVRHAGAKGCVLKSQAARDLTRAIDHLLRGGTFFDSQPET